MNNGALAANRAFKLREAEIPVSERTANRWFDTTAFLLPPNYVWGAQGKNTMRGPGVLSIEFALQKYRAGARGQGVRPAHGGAELLQHRAVRAAQRDRWIDRHRHHPRTGARAAQHTTRGTVHILMQRRTLLRMPAVALAAAARARAVGTIELGSRRELFVDRFLIERMEGTELRLQRPIEREKVLPFDRPWEGALQRLHHRDPRRRRLPPLLSRTARGGRRRAQRGIHLLCALAGRDPLDTSVARGCTRCGERARTT